MSLTPTKHYYSKTSVDAWFRYLTQDWEFHFTQVQLKKGREIYLSSGIREIELNVEDAIVHAEINDKPHYSVIAWEKNVPTIRSSSRRKERAEAIAVAGIYQIEELISDQLAEISISDEDFDDEFGTGDNTSEELDTKPEVERNRPLVLTFSGSEDGLGFDAKWLNLDGSQIAALAAQNGSAPSLTETESESLIRLTTMARQSGFTLDKETRRFLMSDIGRFIPFLSHQLPKWKNHFTIVRETEVTRLMQGIQSVDMDAWVNEISDNGDRTFEMGWQYRAAGSALSDEEAEKLNVKMGQPVYLPNRGIVQLTDNQVNLLSRWKDFRKSAEKKAIERYMILSLFGEGTEKLKLSTSLLNWRKKLFSQPKDLETPLDCLRSYQEKGISWMVHVLREGCHCLLADEMGLGKTVQILAVIDQLRDPDGPPSLVCCPASVIPVWNGEVDRFFPEFKVMKVTGGRSVGEIKDSGADLVLCSYTQLRRNAEAIHKIDFNFCILDEAQVIKNPDTKVSKASYALKSTYRMAVSGTPVENHYKDIWSIFRFLMPDLLGSRAKFEGLVEFGGETFAQRLKNQLAPFILRRTKAEVISELPAKNEMQLNCSMTDVQKKEYTRLVQEGLKKITTDLVDESAQKRSFSFFALLTRLRQVCCDPGLLPWQDADPMKSAKIQLIVEKLADIYAAGHKVVIFSQFVGLIERMKVVLEKEFPALNLFVLTGKTVDRSKPVKGFQSAEHPATILVSLKAGGTGITLHAADYVFLMDPWWNPSVEAQAIDRVHRLGQENPVFVYRVITTGTIEERVQVLQKEKQEMFKSLIEDLKDVSAPGEHLNALKDLISLQS